METWEIIIITILLTLFTEVIISIIWFVISDYKEHKHMNGNKEDEVNFEGLHSIIENFANNIDDIEDETNEEYLENLEEYKKIVDKSPNKFLNFHMRISIKKEQFELAQYIERIAKKRNFNLEI